MAKTLTAAAVAKLRPIKGRVREIPDAMAVGLYLQIFPSGKKTWALRYRRPITKRPAKLTLGTVSEASQIDAKPVIGSHLSLAAARRLVAELRHEIALGRDPGAAHIERKKKEMSTSVGTFSDAAKEFVERRAMRTRQWRETAKTLGLVTTDGGLKMNAAGLAARWRNLPVTQITDDVLFRVIDEARDKGIPGWSPKTKGPSESRARHMHAALSVMFGWLKERRKIPTNPMALLTAPKAPKSRSRTLRNDEIVKFWGASAKQGAIFGPLLRLLLLTGARLNEVAGMRRSELSADLDTWIIPPTRTKNHRELLVPLPPLARELLAGIPTKGDLVFTTNGKTPVSGWSKLKTRLDAATKIPDWRLHDLRRTAATKMAEIGVAPHIVEAVLNHVSGAKAGVAGTYNRAAYTEEKKAALERWADHVDGLVTGRTAKVVELMAKR